MKKSERLFRALGWLDPALIEEADPDGTAASEAKAERRRTRLRWGGLALAACAVLLCCTAVPRLFRAGNAAPKATEAPAAEEATEAPAEPGEGYTGSLSFGTYMSYAGPVLPLTTAEDECVLTAERTVAWDFSETAPELGARVTDSYLLRNDTAEDVTCTMYYPFTGSLCELGELRPDVTADGAAVETALLVGSYAGGFTGAAPDDGTTLNLRQPKCWEDYRDLLDGGAYRRGAGTEKQWPELEQPAVVYTFENFEAPFGSYPAASLAFTYAEQSGVTVLTYGFNGWSDDGTERTIGFIVPDGRRMSPPAIRMLVLGGDFDFTLKGYANLAWEEEIEGVSCTVRREETTLSAVLRELCEIDSASYAGPRSGGMIDPQTCPPELYQAAVEELLCTDGVLGSSPADRYDGGALDEILYEPWILDRVLYVSFELTVPAGGEVTVTADMLKKPSFDFDCGGSAGAGANGFDLMTTLDSTLEIRSIRASLTGLDGCELISDDFGFDGGTEALPDPSAEHYCFELRRSRE